MRAYGLDPSLANFAIVSSKVDKDVLTDVRFVQISSQLVKDGNPKYIDNFTRYVNLNRELIAEGLFDLLGGPADHIYAEIATGSKDTQAAKALAVSTMTSAYLVAMCNCTYDLVTPRNMKEYIGKSSTATKKEIIEIVSGRFPDLPWFRKGGKVLLKNEHLADALSVLLWGLEKDGIEVQKAISNYSSPEWVRC